jgi:hypothetical protein
MKSTRNLLLFAALIGISFQSQAQSGRGPMSTTVVGHMAVTLLSPAAISSIQDLSFNNVSLRSSTSAANTDNSASLSAVNGDMQMGSLKVQGNKATFSVTVSNRSIGLNQNGANISIDNFSTYSNNDYNGASTIYIGATMRVKKAVVDTNENTSPLAVTINYN